jgi:alkylation response protein AidB-like acyl-CoA dehydrogenase
MFVETDDQFEYLKSWQRKLYEAGYLGMDWPTEYGGGGHPLGTQTVVAQELSRAGTPALLNIIGLQWAGPVILKYGTHEQKLRLIRPILSAEEIWCQGFSEPGAGSDLASLTTRADGDGDGEGWKVNGHKVWTTLGQFSKWMILLARTEKTAVKYDGLSFFLFPMEASGVDVQPLVKITGEGGFNQVIFDDAPMPKDALLGALGQGWAVAMMTLTFERNAAEGTGAGSGSTAPGFGVEEVVELARRASRDGVPATQDPWVRDELADVWIREAAMRFARTRSGVPALVSDRPHALALMGKAQGTEHLQRLADLACRILGPDAALWLDDPDAPEGARWPHAYLNSFASTIGGGTSQIQRNIIGERVLGLPKSK